MGAVRSYVVVPFGQSGVTGSKLFPEAELSSYETTLQYSVRESGLNVNNSQRLGDAAEESRWTKQEVELKSRLNHLKLFQLWLKYALVGRTIPEEDCALLSIPYVQDQFATHDPQFLVSEFRFEYGLSMLEIASYYKRHEELAAEYTTVFDLKGEAFSVIFFTQDKSARYAIKLQFSTKTGEKLAENLFLCPVSQGLGVDLKKFMLKLLGLESMQVVTIPNFKVKDLGRYEKFVRVQFGSADLSLGDKISNLNAAFFQS